MAAAGLDGGVAVDARVKAGSETDMKRDVYGERLGRGLEEPPVDYNWKVESAALTGEAVSKGGKEDVGVWIDKHGDFACLQQGCNLISFRSPRCYPLYGMYPFIDSFSKRNWPANRQRLGELGDDHADAGPV
jgi:hypothetical protein